MQTKNKWIMFLAVAIVGIAMSITPAYAGGASVSGFADIIYTVSDDGTAAGTADGESQVTSSAEVDIEAGAGAASVRVDVDLPGATIEQARVDWALGGATGLTLTVGRYNSPVGFEAQDAPDMVATTNGQLFEMVPSNMDGLMLSGGVGGIGVSLMLNNAGGGEQNFGGTLSFAPVGNVDVAVGLLSSDGASGDTTNIVATWNGAMANGGLTTTFEYTENDITDGWGITAQYGHGSHGLTVRYDDVGGNTSTTVAGSYSAADNLTLVLEVNDNDDVAVGGQVLMEAIATF